MYDEKFMNMAFELALKGMGHASPNPLVGAVVVRDGLVLGKGFHEKYGSAHAEVNAINDAKNNGHDVAGATVFCNLEPCSHTNKQTPPCAPFLVENKIAKVVIANIDPNPHVDGGGVAYLKANGVEVITGMLEKKGREINEVFFKFIKTKMPFVHLKLAQTLDGKVALLNGQSKYITGPESLEEVHELRQKYDVIMVGRETVMNDDPGLTNRSVRFEKLSQPLRAVVGNIGEFDFGSKIFNDEYKRNTMIISTDEDVRINQDKVRFLDSQGVALLSAKKNESGKVDLSSMLKSLGSLKMTSILLEGGPTLASAFIREGLVDKVSIFVNTSFVGVGKNAFENLNIESLDNKIELKNKTIKVLGNDVLVEGYLCSQD